MHFQIPCAIFYICEYLMTNPEISNQSGQESLFMTALLLLPFTTSSRCIRSCAAQLLSPSAAVQIRTDHITNKLCICPQISYPKEYAAAI
jgi:hypothetical protein